MRSAVITYGNDTLLVDSFFDECIAIRSARSAAQPSSYRWPARALDESIRRLEDYGWRCFPFPPACFRPLPDVELAEVVLTKRPEHVGWGLGLAVGYTVTFSADVDTPDEARRHTAAVRVKGKPLTLKELVNIPGAISYRVTVERCPMLEVIHEVETKLGSLVQRVEPVFWDPVGPRS